MLLSVALPPALAIGGVAKVVLLHATEGDRLRPHAGLLDFSVDLSAGAAHDCPPVMHYRLLVREGGWLRRLRLRAGDPIAPGAALALLATEADDPAEGPPDSLATRPARVTVASIVFHAEGWGGRP